MLVGLINTKPNSGSTVIGSSLAALFSITQRQDTVFMSTGPMAELKASFSSDAFIKGADLNVLEVLIKSLDEKDRDRIFDHSENPEVCFAHFFDIYSGVLVDAKADDLFSRINTQSPSSLNVVEIKGDYMSERNQKILKQCHTYLIVTNLYNGVDKDIDKIKEDVKTIKLFKDPGVVVTRCDERTMSPKEMSKFLDIPTSHFRVVPYSEFIPYYLCKQGFNDYIANMAVAKGSLLKVRTGLIEILKFLFDDKEHKVINTSRLVK